jgi:5-hydroxyisourate hydrolase-like protein (transthyretin family)
MPARIVLVLLGCVLMVGCGPSGPQRVPTYPVKGVVLVDGQPAAGVAIRCIPMGERDRSIPETAAFTREDGSFQLSTYEQSDGVPEGEYALTFQWGEMNLITRSYVGDKLKGKYADPQNSPVRFKVEKGKPIDLGKIELTTQ